MHNSEIYLAVIVTITTILYGVLFFTCEDDPQHFSTRCGDIILPQHIYFITLQAWLIQSFISIAGTFLATGMGKRNTGPSFFVLMVFWQLVSLFLWFAQSRNISLEQCRSPISQHDFTLRLDPEVYQTIEFYSTTLNYLPDDQWPAIINETGKTVIASAEKQLINYPCSKVPMFTKNVLLSLRFTQCQSEDHTNTRDLDRAIAGISWVHMKQKLATALPGLENATSSRFRRRCVPTLPYVPPLYLLKSAKSDHGAALLAWLNQTIVVMEHLAKQYCPTSTEQENEREITHAVADFFKLLEEDPLQMSQIEEKQMGWVSQQACKKFFDQTLVLYEAWKKQPPQHNPAENIETNLLAPSCLVLAINILLALPLIFRSDEEEIKKKKE